MDIKIKTIGKVFINNEFLFFCHVVPCDKSNSSYLVLQFKSLRFDGEGFDEWFENLEDVNYYVTKQNWTIKWFYSLDLISINSILIEENCYSEIHLNLKNNCLIIFAESCWICYKGLKYNVKNFSMDISDVIDYSVDVKVENQFVPFKLEHNKEITYWLRLINLTSLYFYDDIVEIVASEPDKREVLQIITLGGDIYGSYESREG